MDKNTGDPTILETCDGTFTAASPTALILIGGIPVVFGLVGLFYNFTFAKTVNTEDKTRIQHLKALALAMITVAFIFGMFVMDQTTSESYTQIKADVENEKLSHITVKNASRNLLQTVNMSCFILRESFDELISDIEYADYYYNEWNGNPISNITNIQTIPRLLNETLDELNSSIAYLYNDIASRDFRYNYDQLFLVSESTRHDINLATEIVVVLFYSLFILHSFLRSNPKNHQVMLFNFIPLIILVISSTVYVMMWIYSLKRTSAENLKPVDECKEFHGELGIVFNNISSKYSTYKNLTSNLDQWSSDLGIDTGKIPSDNDDVEMDVRLNFTINKVTKRMQSDEYQFQSFEQQMAALFKTCNCSSLHIDHSNVIKQVDKYFNYIGYIAICLCFALILTFCFQFYARKSDSSRFNIHYFKNYLRMNFRIGPIDPNFGSEYYSICFKRRAYNTMDGSTANDQVLFNRHGRGLRDTNNEESAFEMTVSPPKGILKKPVHVSEQSTSYSTAESQVEIHHEGEPTDGEQSYKNGSVGSTNTLESSAGNPEASVSDAKL